MTESEDVKTRVCIESNARSRSNPAYQQDGSDEHLKKEHRKSGRQRAKSRLRGKRKEEEDGTAVGSKMGREDKPMVDGHRGMCQAEARWLGAVLQFVQNSRTIHRLFI